MTPRSLAVAATVLTSLSTPPSFAAYYFEARSTGDDAGAAGTVTGWIDAGKARIEFRDGGAAMFEAGSYMLTTDGGATVYLVNPGERAYSQLDVEQIFQSIGTAMNAIGGLVNMEFADFTSEKLLEEPGGDVLGYPTTHYRFKTGYTMRMAMLGMRRQSRIDTDQEIWCTTAIDRRGFDLWLRPDRFRTGNADIDRLIEQQYGDVDCLPLRTRMVTTATDADGRSETTTTVTEVTVLREDTPPSGTFDLPAGYRNEPLPTLPAGLPTSFGAGDDDAGEESAPRRRPRLRDLIGR